MHSGILQSALDILMIGIEIEKMGQRRKYTGNQLHVEVQDEARCRAGGRRELNPVNVVPESSIGPRSPLSVPVIRAFPYRPSMSEFVRNLSLQSLKPLINKD